MNKTVLITARQAGDKACPFTFGATRSDGERGACIADQCMAWRIPDSVQMGRLVGMDQKGYCHLIHSDGGKT